MTHEHENRLRCLSFLTSSAGRGLLLLAFAATACATTPGAPAEDAAVETEAADPAGSAASEPTLVGVWEYVGDDDRPEGELPSEVMSIAEDGTIVIEGDHTIHGHWHVDGDALVFRAWVKGVLMNLPRPFELDAEGLRFKNKETGYAYYRRLDRAPTPYDPFHGWEPIDSAYLRLKAPSGWKVRSEPADANGVQRLMIGSPAGDAILVLARHPREGDENSADLGELLEVLAGQMLSRFPGGPHTPEALPADARPFGLAGPAYRATIESPAGALTTTWVAFVQGDHRVFVTATGTEGVGEALAQVLSTLEVGASE